MWAGNVGYAACWDLSASALKWEPWKSLQRLKTWMGGCSPIPSLKSWTIFSRALASAPRFNVSKKPETLAMKGFRRCSDTWKIIFYIIYITAVDHMLRDREVVGSNPGLFLFFISCVLNQVPREGTAMLLEAKQAYYAWIEKKKCFIIGILISFQGPILLKFWPIALSSISNTS